MRNINPMGQIPLVSMRIKLGIYPHSMHKLASMGGITYLLLKFNLYIYTALNPHSNFVFASCTFFASAAGVG